MRARSAWIISLWMAGLGIVAAPSLAQSPTELQLPASAAAVEAPVKASAPVRRPSRARPAGAQAYVYKGTSSGDNLWDLAGAVVGPAGQAEPIDRNQVMVAIFRANPEAFPEGNMHRIQRGLDLTIPSRADIRREDRAQAVVLVAQHRRAYADRRLTPQPLYALGGAEAASAAQRAAAASAASAAALASAPEASAGTGPAGWVWAAGFVALAGLAAVVLRLMARGPVLFDPELDDAPPQDVQPDLDAVAEAERDRLRADAAAANLYQEDLSLPPVAPAETPEPAPLPANDPAQADALSNALSDAYRELERPPQGQVPRP